MDINTIPNVTNTQSLADSKKNIGILKSNRDNIPNLIILRYPILSAKIAINGSNDASTIKDTVMISVARLNEKLK